MANVENKKYYLLDNNMIVGVDGKTLFYQEEQIVNDMFGERKESPYVYELKKYFGQDTPSRHIIGYVRKIETDVKELICKGDLVRGLLNDKTQSRLTEIVSKNDIDTFCEIQEVYKLNYVSDIYIKSYPKNDFR